MAKSGLIIMTRRRSPSLLLLYLAWSLVLGWGARQVSAERRLQMRMKMKLKKDSEAPSTEPSSTPSEFVGIPNVAQSSSSPPTITPPASSELDSLMEPTVAPTSPSNTAVPTVSSVHSAEQNEYPTVQPIAQTENDGDNDNGDSTTDIKVEAPATTTVKLPSLVLSFDLVAGIAMDPELFREILEQFLRNLLLTNHGPATVELDTTIKYNPVTGWGSAVVNGRWSGGDNEGDLPTEATYIRGFAFWRSNELQHKLSDIGYSMQRLQVTVNGKSLQENNTNNVAAAKNEDSPKKKQSYLVGGMILFFVAFVEVVLIIIVRVMRQRMELQRKLAFIQPLGSSIPTTKEEHDKGGFPAFPANNQAAAGMTIPIATAIASTDSAAGGQFLVFSDQSVISSLVAPTIQDDASSHISTFPKENGAVTPASLEQTASGSFSHDLESPDAFAAGGAMNGLEPPEII